MDCFLSILSRADKYDVDIENEFFKIMDELETRAMTTGNKKTILFKEQLLSIEYFA